MNKVDRVVRIGQLFSAAAFSLGHGGNDAQKTMGIITIVLVAGGFAQMDPGGKLPTPELWVILAAHAAIGLGTLSGGWRIVKTMGTKIVKFQPVGGFCAETAGAATLFGATFFGIPVSTTHTITGAIVGVGSAKRFSAVKWGVADRADHPDGRFDRRFVLRNRTYSRKDRRRRINKLRNLCLKGRAQTGNSIVKVVPTPGSDSAETSPPWSLARCFTIARPSPVPPTSRERARSAL